MQPAENLEEALAGVRRIALVGNPNVGKSVVFGALTGTYATVSNYPGTTVEVARARARANPEVEVIDTPGANSLTPNSEDEQVTRDILLAGVECVVQVVDAKNLVRGLAVSLQLAEAALPFVLVVNMLDEAADRGLRIDTAALADALGVPVVPTIAITGQGLKDLAASLSAAAVSHRRVTYPDAVEEAVARIQGSLTGFGLGPRWLALLCLAGDETMHPWLAHHLPAAALERIEEVRRSLQASSAAPPRYRIGRTRMAAAERLAAEVSHADADESAAHSEPRRWLPFGILALVGAAVLMAGDTGALPPVAATPLRIAGWAALGAAAAAAYASAGMRAAVGRWSVRPGSSLAVLAVVLYVLYRFVGVFAAGTAVDFLEHAVFGRYLGPAAVGAVDWSVAEAARWIGASAADLHLLRDMLVGPYGLITVALTYALAIILPIVTAFFIAFSILEDSGYLPRLAVVVNRVFRKMGLNGKAVLPMVLGLGCDTMATLTARIMETRKERLVVTLLLALGVPCSAQLGVILGLFGALPWWAPLVWAGVVTGVLFAVGFLASQLLPGDRSDLILEIPPMRRPQLANIAVKTVGRLEWYLKEAVPVFVLGTFVLFVLDATGALARIVRASEPVVVGLLSLPPKSAEAFLIGFFRRDYGSAGIYALFQQGQLSPVQAVVALVTITLFVPCVANFFIIVKERGLRTAAAMSAFIFPFAFIVGAAVNLGLRAVGLP